ncbi:hypothetical protein AX15_005997 [Amanita polypyramis BW_CC]|nr:hypothetical protein AX15_005997 [Amanita polypyramis BW_CC]
MAPKKSIFRQPGARHFQLVHRSQRDPLIHDPDASQHVLKPFERGSTRKGKTRVELESILSSDDVEHDRQAHVGEAALYGIYYDDTQYDYMQHLRAAGVQENGIESILIEAPRSENKDKESSYLQLPADIFASKTELPRNYESQQAVPDSIAGLQPDMDPHLRQVLEALDDDAFVDDEIDDEYFTKLVKDGERGPDRDPKSEFDEDGLDEEDDDNCDVGPGEDAPWEERFAYFKKTREVNMGGQSDDEFVSERDDTVESLPTLSVIGRKGRRRKGSSEASGYSMSSWSMYRNEALQTLDERFDKLLLKEYNEGETTMSDKDEDTDEAPELITSRDDFEAMMSEFMNEYEILGRKMQPKLPGDTGTERFGTLRRSMGQDNRITVHEDSEDEKILVSMENKKDRWDCETIICKYRVTSPSCDSLLRDKQLTQIWKIILELSAQWKVTQ